MTLHSVSGSRYEGEIPLSDVYKRQNGGRGGSRKSTAKGSSVEFSDFREYMPGDDIRRIDWNRCV